MTPTPTSRFLKFNIGKLLLVGVLLLPFLASAQYNNEWIDFEKRYYTIEVNGEGIYRLTYEELFNFGFPVNGVNPKHLQLFFRGEEQAIIVSGQEDNIFDPSDYLEFYAPANDGFFDGKMFEEDGGTFLQPHRGLYTESSFLMLTYTLDGTLGKRMQTAPPTAGSTETAVYHTKELLLSNRNGFSIGYFLLSPSGAGSGPRDSRWTEAEGYYHGAVTDGNTATFELPTVSALEAPINYEIEITLGGDRKLPNEAKSNTARLSIAANGGSFRELGETSFQGHKGVTLKYTLQSSDIGATQTTLRIANVSADPSLILIGSVKLTFAQSVPAYEGEDNFWFSLPEVPAENLRLEIANAASEARLFDLTDPNGGKILQATVSNGNLSAVFPNNATAGKSVFLATETRSISSIRQSTIFEVEPSEYDYIILTHPNMKGSANGYSNVATAYAQYRNSAAGGNFRSLVITVQEVYDQFSFGEVTPYAIRDFCRFMIQRGNPRYLFIAGRGLNLQTPQLAQAPNLIPTYGFPGSDIDLTARLPGSNGYDPAIPTSRLPCRNAQELADYLDKVKGQEGTEITDPWKKRILHLSGGRGDEENTRFRNFLNQFKTRAEDKELGGRVATVSKETFQTIEFINVVEEVNKGVLLMTFFGHSDTQLTDIDVGFATDPSLGYANENRYPMMIMNGCSGGKMFGQNLTFAENWIHAPQKGSILFLGFSELGFDGILANYSNTFYQTAFQEIQHIARPIGDIHKTMLRKYQEDRIRNNSQDIFHIANMQQFLLMGDPAVQLFGRNKPDYRVEEEKIAFTSLSEKALSARSDSFLIKFPVFNLGTILPEQAVSFSIRRTFPDGSTINLSQADFSAISYADTVSAIILNTAFKDRSAGLNRFEIILDPLNAIDEANETNNIGSIEVLLPNGAGEIVLPYDFATLSEREVDIIGFNSDPQNTDRAYYFQLDTGYQFNSPALRDTVIMSRQTPRWRTFLGTAPEKDTVTFFVRFRLNDPSPLESDEWDQSSFTYVRNSSPGWMQRTSSQFRENTLQTLTLPNDYLDWKFLQNRLNIEATTTGYLSPSVSYSVKVNGFEIVPDQSCAGGLDNNRLIFIKFNVFTGEPYANNTVFSLSNLGFQSLYCGTGQDFAFFVPNDRLTTSIIDNLYNELILNEGDYVLMMPLLRVDFRTLLEEKREIIQNLGFNVTAMDQLRNGDPFIGLGRKNAGTNIATEFYPDFSDPAVPPNNQVLNGNFTVDFDFDQGSMRTELIGPALAWNAVLFDSLRSDSAGDEAVLQITPMAANGTAGNPLLASSEEISLAQISAAQFPYLRLQWSVKDEANRTPVFLDNWEVLYTPAPEGILLFDEPTLSSELPLVYEEGDSLRVSMIFENVSTTDFQAPVQVEYEIVSQEDGKKETVIVEIPAVQAGESHRFSFAFPTRFWLGRNRLFIKVNDQVQPELLYSNNSLQLNYQVNKDIRNPLLSVLFDGRRIMDGEIVSPSPQITVSVDDENQFLFQGDTTKVNLFFTRCEGCSRERIPFASERVSWQTTNDNNFLIYYQPESLPDGNYTFEVTASDVSDNRPGTEAFRVTFEVINVSSITHFYPYPNPFSDNVRFVFTLTGSDVPDEVKIQIMTVSGRVVREILQDEIGPLHIGNNITQYAWDGRDEFGDQLANGVYLYRVFVRASGGNIPLVQDTELNESRSSAVKSNEAKFFKNNIGKMYLLR